MSAPAFDLQSHSLHSDGELSAAQVVENAAAAGVKLLALSDHDTIDGVDEALASGALHGVRVVPATEISAVDGQYEDLHVLGYGIDHRSRQLGERLLDGFKAYADHPLVGDVRGLGLMAAVELVSDKKTKAGFDPSLKIADRISQEFRQRGLYSRARGETIMLGRTDTQLGRVSPGTSRGRSSTRRRCSCSSVQISSISRIGEAAAAATDRHASRVTGSGLTQSATTVCPSLRLASASS